MSRILKISLIIFFVSENSWNNYNKFIVTFFKDGTDYLVALVMNFTDQHVDKSSMISIAQMDRASDTSSATRFSYVDVVIKNLLSKSVAKKVFALFFNSIFGFIYIPAIYALICYFIYVMIFIAMAYIVNMLKIIFVLSLGPLFIIFSLFSKTADMFRNWVGFLGGRSLEIIILFTVLYFFLSIIDKTFANMLSYRACGELKGIGEMVFLILIAYVDRTFPEWVIMFISIAGLLFITKMVSDQVPSVVGSLFSVSIGGGKAGGGGGSFGIANAAASAGLGLLKDAASGLGSAAGAAINNPLSSWVGRGIAKYTGLSALSKINPVGMYNNYKIDSAIKAATTAANKSNLQGKERDSFIRSETLKALQGKMDGKAFSIGNERVLKRLNQKLVKDPLKKFIQDKAKELKSKDPQNMKFGKEMRQAIKEDARKWAKENLASGGADKIDKYLKGSMKNFIREESQLNSSLASEKFKGNERLQNKYLQSLYDNEFKKHNARKDHKNLDKVSDWFKDKYNAITDSKFSNSRTMAESYTSRNEMTKLDGKIPLLNFLNRKINNQQIGKLSDSSAKTALISYLSEHSFVKPGKEEQEKEKREFFRDKLRGLISNEMKDRTKDELEKMSENKNINFFERTFIKSQLKGIGHEELAKKELGESLEDKIKNGKMFDNAEDEMKKYSKDKLQQLEEKILKLDNAPEDKKSTELELIKKQLEVDFGAPITQVLLKEADVGLTASNVLLGITTSGADIKSKEMAVAALNVNKDQFEARERVAKYEVKIKQAALDKIDDTPENQKERFSISKDIEKLEKDIAAFNKEGQRLENEIMQLNLG